MKAFAASGRRAGTRFQRIHRSLRRPAGAMTLLGMSACWNFDRPMILSAVKAMFNRVSKKLIARSWPIY